MELMTQNLSPNDTFLIDMLSSYPDQTKRTYVHCLNQFQDYLTQSGGDLQSLTRSDVQAWLYHLQYDRRLAATTISKHFHSVKTWCKVTGQSNATEALRVPKRPRFDELPVKSLDRNERHQLVRDVERSGNIRNMAIVATLLYTGLRISELASLNVPDLTLGERAGSVRVIGKGNKERIVPVPPEARFWLLKYLNQRTEGPVFLSNRKKRMANISIQEMLAKYHIHAHMLRHTYCRLLVAAGVDLVTVATLAGHADINVTRRYAKPNQEELESAISKAFSQ